MDILFFEQELLRKAKEYGFTDSEVLFLGGKEFEVLVLEGSISHYENSNRQGIAFRGRICDREGSAYTEELTQEAILPLLREAAENAALTEPNDTVLFYGAEESYPEFAGYNTHLNALSAAERVEAAKRMEAAALDEENVAAIDYCVLRTHETEVALSNSRGLALSYRKNGVDAYVCAIAKDGQEIKTGDMFWAGNNWNEFDPVATGQEAARRAASLLGAQSVPSGSYEVVLDAEVMAALLQAFCGVFFAENAQKGFSLLGGKTGEKIAADCVCLRDDALLENGFASVPFDSEGTACRNKTVVENGVLRTLLYHRLSAAKEGVLSTGNGFRAGLKAPVKTACTNFYLEKGILELEQLLGALTYGLYITDVTGLHAGTNAVSGDFSLSAQGYLISYGEKVHPVEQITIAGNFYELLQKIMAVGIDLHFRKSGIGSPSVLVCDLDIAGM